MTGPITPAAAPKMSLFSVYFSNHFKQKACFLLIVSEWLPEKIKTFIAHCSAHVALKGNVLPGMNIDSSRLVLQRLTEVRPPLKSAAQQLFGEWGWRASYFSTSFRIYIGKRLAASTTSTL